MYSNGTTNTTLNNIPSGHTATVLPTAPSTTYTILSATDSDGCTADVSGATATVSILPAPNAQPETLSPTPICADTDLELNESGGDATEWEWTGPASFSSTDQSPLISGVTTSNSGTYRVTVTDGNGCMASASVSVTVFNPPSNVSALSNFSERCNGQNLDLNATGTGATSWLWDGPNGYASSQQNPPAFAVIYPDDAGTYTVTASNAAGCTATNSVDITVFESPTAQIQATNLSTGNSNFCTDDELGLDDLGCGGCDDWEWSGPAGFSDFGQSVTVSPVVGGLYRLTVTDANACTATDQTSITVFPLPNPSADSNTPVCEGATLQLSGSGCNGCDWIWQSPDGSQFMEEDPDFQDVPAAASGTFFVTVTNANGCTAEATTDVEIHPLPVLNMFANTPLNAGETLNVDCGDTGNEYAWTLDTDPAFSNEAPFFEILNAQIDNAGTYSVAVTTGEGCTTTGSILVEINAACPTLTATSNSPVCAGDTLSLSATLGGNYDLSTFQWSGPGGWSSSNPMATRSPAVAGIYTASVSDFSGCTAAQTLTVSVLLVTATVTANISPGAVCQNGLVSVSATSNSNIDEWAWQTPDGQFSDEQNTSFFALIPGDYVVTLTATPTNGGCPATATATATVHPLPAVNPAANLPICAGDDLLMETGAGANMNFVWSGPNNFSASTASATVPDMDATKTGSYFVTITSSDGCEFVAEFDAQLSPGPAVVASSNSPVCPGAAVNFTANITGNFTQITWSGPGGWSSNLQNPTRSPVVPGNYIVQVQGNSSSCATSDTVAVGLAPVQASITAPATSVCAGQSLTLTASPAVAWLWDDGSTARTRTVAPTATTIYSLTATYAGGCTSIADLEITVKPSPTLAPTANSPVCAGDPLQLMAGSTGATIFSWTGPGFASTQRDPVLSPVGLSNAGQFVVVGTAPNGCTASGTVDVAVFEKPDITEFIPTAVSCPGGSDGSIILSVAGGSQPFDFQWNEPSLNGQQNPQNLPPGLYEVTVTDAVGCFATASASVGEPAALALACAQQSPVSLPGATDGAATFTPNGGTAPFEAAWPGGSLQNLPENVAQAIPNLAEGSYTVTLTDAKGCTATCSFSIGSPGCAGFGPLDLSAANTRCNGGSDGTLTVTANGGTAPFLFAWVGTTSGQLPPQGTASATIPNLPAGNYTVTFTDAAGCTATANATISEPNPLVFNALQNTPADAGLPNGSATATFSGGTADYSIAWSGNSSGQLNPPSGSGQATLPNLFAGNYTATLTDANGCTATQTFDVQENAPGCTLANAAVSAQNVACFGQSNGSATLSFTGGQAPFSFVWKDAAGATVGTTQSVGGLAAGLVFATVTDALGCEISASANISQPPLVPPTNLSQTICAGQSVNFCGIDRDQTGTFSCNLTAAGGCDSVVTLNLQVLPQIQTSVSQTICAGNSVNFCGTDQDQSGTFTCNLTAAGGCDSIVTLDLQVLPQIQTAISRTICAGNSVNFCGVDRDQSGSYSCVFTANGGCDSVVTLNLQVLPQIQNSISQTICAGNSVNFCGIDRDQSGSYSCVFTANGGCDSVVTLNLQVLPKIQTSVSQTICAGNSVNFCGIDQNQSGIFTCNLTATGGCDSVVTLNLQVLPQIQTAISRTICAGNSVNFCGIDQDQTGTFTCNLTATGGCDSVVTLNLQVLPQIQTSISQTICAGNSVNFCGIDRDQSGSYSCVLTATGGCDSVVTLNLMVLPQIQTSISQTICAGNSVNFCGIDRDQSGTFTCNLTAVGGCDSTVTLNLLVLPQVQTSFSQTICNGQSVNFCGIDRDQTGTFSCNLTAVGGCDSTVTLNLTVNPKPSAGISAFPGTVVSCRNDTLQLTATGASGGSIAWSTGEAAPFIYPSAGGTFSVTVTAGGCSDTASIEILEDKKPPVVSLSLSQPSIFCSGQTVVVTASSPDNPSYQWQGGPATGEQFPTNSAGLVFVKATTPNGCDTTLSINVPQAVPTTETFAETLCAGRCAVFADVERCATGIYRDTIRTVSGGCDSVLRTFNLVVLSAPVQRDTVRLCAGGATVFCNEKIYEPGTYDCLLETPGGCDTVLSRTVELLETPSLLANDDAALLPIGETELEIRPGENDTLPGDGNWSVALVGQPPKVGSVAPAGTGKQLIFRLEDPDFSGSDVFLYALCSATCTGVCDTAQVSLLLPNDDFESVKKEYSNVVTPNDDGLNDRFVPMAAFQKQNIPVVEAQSELSVFNRWGELVFWADAPPLEWNGRDVDGTPMPQATYYFVFRASVQGRIERKVLAGAVTVLR